MTFPDPVTRTNQTLQLLHDRTLGYAEYGSENGRVLLYCHGYPGSRLEAAWLDEYGRQANVRILSIDRPGVGLSSFQPGRSFLDWPDDVVALTDRLKMDRFAIVGSSGGSPYALACAYKIPERLATCGVVSGIGPLALGTAGMSRSNRLIFFCARWFPWLLTPIFESMARSFQNEEQANKALAKMMQQMVKSDREALLASGAEKFLAASTAEAFRQGSKGNVYEGRLYGQDWGFRLEDIALQPLYLWHGELDHNVPVVMARMLAGKLSNCQATYYPDEGHLSIMFNHREEMVSTLVSALS